MKNESEEKKTSPLAVSTASEERPESSGYWGFLRHLPKRNNHNGHSTGEPEAKSEKREGVSNHTASKNTESNETESNQTESEPTLADLFAEGRYDLLAAECERRLHQDEKDREARIWWVRVEFRRKAMPLSILSAPLDEVTKKIAAENESGDIVQLAALVLEEVGEALLTSGETKVALTLLERAFAFDPARTQALEELLRQEIERDKNDSRLRRTEREKEHMARISAVAAAVKKQQRNDRAKAQESASSQTAEKERSQQDLSSPKEEKPVVAALAGGKKEKSPGTSDGRYTAPLMAIIVLLLASHFWSDISAVLFSSNSTDASAGFFSAEEAPTLLLPKVERIGSFDRLDAIFYEIGQSEGQSEEQSEVGSSKASSVSPALAGPGKEQRGQKAQVNTAGPVEPEEVRRLREDGQGAARESNASINVKNIFEKPKSERPSGAVALPVEKFSSPKVFVIIADSSVMSTASYRGVGIAQVKVGDKVLVDSRLGPWLRIRAKSGRSGYVLAQNAHEAR